MGAYAYQAPTSVEEALAVLTSEANAGNRTQMLAGGTDLLVQMRSVDRGERTFVDVKHVAEANELSIGAHCWIFLAQDAMIRIALFDEIPQGQLGFLVYLRNRTTVGLGLDCHRLTKITAVDFATSIGQALRKVNIFFRTRFHGVHFHL